MNFRDVELLSAYLDGRLNPSESARLEARLSSEPNLKATLEDLRQTRGLLRRLPQRRAPRDFRLTPKMAGIRPPEARAYPVFRFATALTAFLFVAAVAVNAITPFAAPRLAAAPPPIAFGKGGGGGGGSGQFTEEAPAQQAPAPTEAPAATQAPFAALAPTGTPEGAPSIAEATAAAPQAEDATRAVGAAPSPEANQTGPAASGLRAEEPSSQPVPLPWVIGLGVVMLICAAAAGLVRLNNDRQVRQRWNKK